MVGDSRGGARSWVDKELAILRQMAGKATTKAIAEAINAACGTSRTGNAVIGMAHRLGVDLGGKKQGNRPSTPGRPSGGGPQRRKPAAAVWYGKQRERKPRASHARPAPIPRPKPKPCPWSVADVPLRACRWIEGDPRAERPFACDQPVMANEVYCVEHRRRSVDRRATTRPVVVKL